MREYDLKSKLNTGAEILEGFVEITVFSIFTSVFIQSLLFLFNLPLSSFVFYLSLGLYPIFYSLLNKAKVISFRTISLYFVFAFVLGLGFMYFKQFIQYAWDGSDYHGGAMVQMIKGWNPFYDLHGYAEFTISVWSKAYPKLTWIFGAIVIKLFGNTSAGMLINLLVALASSLKVIVYSKKHLSSTFIPVVLGVLIFLNPIFIEQLHTFYVDGVIANLVILLFVYNLELTEQYTQNNLFYIVLLSVMLMNIKFTGAVYAAVIDFGAFSFLLITRSKHLKQYVIAGVLMLVIGIGIIGFNPYTTNLYAGHHIFYPVMGSDYVEVEIAKNTPDILLPLNSFEKMIYSMKSGRSWIENLVSIKSFGYLLFDQRIGGFGSQFIKLLILTMGTLMWTVISKVKHLSLNVLFMSLAFIVSIILNYQYLWWARYIPHLWALFAYSIFILNYYYKNNYVYFVIAIVLSLVLFQSQDIYRNTYKKDQQFTQEAKEVFRSLESRKNLTVYFDTFGYLNIIPVYLEQIAKENGVDIQEVMYYDPPKEVFECQEFFYSKICVKPD